MKDFFSEATERTPLIKGSIESGELTIEGRSLPEDAKKFYHPFRDWINELIDSKTKSISAQFYLEYFNTSTSKVLVDIMLLLDSCSHDKNIEIIWYHDEDDHEMEEVGKDFQSMLGHIVKLKPKSF